MKRDAREQYERQVKEKYIRGVQENRPAVMAINAFAASTAVLEMLAREFSLGLERIGSCWRDPGPLGVGLANHWIQSRTMKYEHGSVLALGNKIEGRAVKFNAGELVDKLLVEFRSYATRSAVRYVAIGIDGAEIDPDRHVVPGQRQTDAKGRQGAAADIAGDRVVAEERQVPGAAARRYPGCHRNAKPGDAGVGERVKIRRIRDLQLSPAGIGMRQTAQTVDDEQDHPLIARLGEVLQNRWRQHCCIWVEKAAFMRSEA